MDNYPNHTKRQLAAGKVALGMRFILSGSDLSFVLAVGRERASFLHGIKI